MRNGRPPRAVGGPSALRAFLICGFRAGACRGRLHFLNFPPLGVIVTGSGKFFALLAVAVLAAPAPMAAAQEESEGRRILDVVRDRITRELERVDRVETAQPQADGEPRIIDFELTSASAAAAALTTQYRQSHGVAFGKGATVQFCTNDYDEFNVRLCPYPRAASGQHAAMHDVETGGPAMQIGFDDPVSSVSMRINPTGGRLDEEFIARIIGFDANGNRAGVSELRFNWFQDAFTWPTGVAIEAGEGEGFSRIDISLRRVANNNLPVRFLIDDLTFTPALLDAPPPVAAAIAAQDGPPQIGRAVVVQSPEVGPAQSTLQIYPAAVRKRLAIDWNAVDAALADQASLGLAAAEPAGAGQKYVDIAELPVLLPQAADAGTLQVFGNADTVNAVWRANGRDYSVYGSRLVTVIEKAQGASGVQSAITFSGTDDDLTASFSLYGASYALAQFCNGGADADPACYDRDALGRVAEGLVVVVGEAGRTRP